MNIFTETSEVYQTPNERVIYTIDTTNWGGTPTSPSAKAYDEGNSDTDVTTTLFPTNSPSVSSDDIALSLLRAMTVAHTYRIETAFTNGYGTQECIFKANCIAYYIVGTFAQSATASVARTLDTTDFGGTPTSIVITAYDETLADTDVTSTIISNASPSASGDDIPYTVKSLTKGHVYRIAIKFTSTSSQIFEPSIRAYCVY
jgi:hypothetical protein